MAVEPSEPDSSQEPAPAALAGGGANPCCAKLLKKLQKSETSRKALREAVKLLESENAKLQNENSELGRVCKEERLRGDSAEAAKETESDARDMLEKEIIELKAQNSTLQKTQNICQNDNELLLISQLEEENRRLKMVLEEEKKKSSSEKKKTEEEKATASEMQKLLKSETRKFEEYKSIAGAERKVANDLRASCEKLRTEVNEAKAQLVAQIQKTEEARKLFEAQKQKTALEKRHVESEKLLAEKNKRLIEAERKKVAEEKSHADRLFARLEDQKKLNEELRATIEVERKSVMSEKSHADHLLQKLEEEKKQNEYLQRKPDDSCAMRDDISFGKHGWQHVDMVTESANVKLLKEKLKLKKKQLKHVKNVSKLDKAKNVLVRRELQRLKQDWLQLLSQFNMLEDQLSDGAEGIRAMTQTNQQPEGHEYEQNLLPHNPAAGPYFALQAGMAPFTSSTPITSCARPISGTSSELEPPDGCSLRTKSKNHHRSSCPTSMSDKKFMGSQGKDSLFVSSTETRKKQSSTVLKLPPKDINVARKQYGNSAHQVSGDFLQHKVSKPSLSSGAEVIEKIPSGNKKRKRTQKSRESIALLSSKHDVLHSKTKADNISTNNVLSIDGVRSCPQKGNNNMSCVTEDDVQNRRRKCHIVVDIIPSFTAPATEPSPGVGNACPGSSFVSLLSFEKMVGGNCLKLLDLDNNADEEKYRKAIEAPLSPNLPVLLSPTTKSHISNESSQHLYKGAPDKNMSHQACETSLDPAQTANTINMTSDSMIGQQCRSKTTPIYFVGVTRMKRSNIINVFRYWESLICEARKLHEETFVDGPLLERVSTEPLLLVDEKVSLIFSILLWDVCRFTSEPAVDGNFTSSTFFMAVKVYMEPRWTFLKSTQLDIFISLIVDFLVKREVVVCDKMGDRKLDASKYSHMDDESGIQVSTKPATVDQFISGCTLLASVCVKVDRVDIVLKISYKVLQMGRRSTSWTMLALHVFASLCGDKYLGLKSCSFLMKTIRLIVMLLESTDTSLCLVSSYIQSNRPTEFLSCAHCLFDVDTVPIDGFISSLLGELDLCSLLWNNRANTNEIIASSSSLLGSSGLEINCDESCNISKQAKRSEYIPVGRDLCYFVEIISLLELFGSYMSCEWTYNNIVVRLLKILESCTCEDYSAALLVLISQLGRFFVDDVGYESKTVIEFRNKLSVLTAMSFSRSRSIPIQFSAIGAMLSLLPLTFDKIVATQSAPSSCLYALQVRHIYEWFAQLSKENQSLACSFLAENQ